MVWILVIFICRFSMVVGFFVACVVVFVWSLNNMFLRVFRLFGCGVSVSVFVCMFSFVGNIGGFLLIGI